MGKRSLLLLLYLTAAGISVLARRSVAQEKPKFGYFQCRADAQKWTFDPFDKSLDAKYLKGTAIMVNGQFRVLPTLSYGATAAELAKRAYEASVCIHEDAEFEKQFVTYSRLKEAYEQEEAFRYMNFLLKPSSP